MYLWRGSLVMGRVLMFKFFISLSSLGKPTGGDCAQKSTILRLNITIWCSTLVRINARSFPIAMTPPHSQEPKGLLERQDWWTTGERRYYISGKTRHAMPTKIASGILISNSDGLLTNVVPAWPGRPVERVTLKYIVNAIIFYFNISVPTTYF